MPEIQNTRVTPRKRLSRIPQLMVRKHAGNPKHQGDAILERLLAIRHALGQGPSNKPIIHSRPLRTTYQKRAPTSDPFKQGKGPLLRPLEVRAVAGPCPASPASASDYRAHHPPGCSPGRYLAGSVQSCDPASTRKALSLQLGVLSFGYVGVS